MLNVLHAWFKTAVVAVGEKNFTLYQTDTALMDAR